MSLFTHRKPFASLDAELQVMLCRAGLEQVSSLSYDEMGKRVSVKSERAGVGLAFLQGGRQRGTSWARMVLLQSEITSCMVAPVHRTGLQPDGGKDFSNDPTREREYIWWKAATLHCHSVFLLLSSRRVGDMHTHHLVYRWPNYDMLYLELIERSLIVGLDAKQDIILGYL